MKRSVFDEYFHFSFLISPLSNIFHPINKFRPCVYVCNLQKTNRKK